MLEFSIFIILVGEGSVYSEFYQDPSGQEIIATENNKNTLNFVLPRNLTALRDLMDFSILRATFFLYHKMFCARNLGAQVSTDTLQRVASTQ